MEEKADSEIQDTLHAWGTIATWSLSVSDLLAVNGGDGRERAPASRLWSPFFSPGY